MVRKGLVWSAMSVESFHARVQRHMRVQIPRLIRWRYKLIPGQVFQAGLERSGSYGDEQFWVQMQKGGRFAIPKLVAEVLELEPHDLVKVTLWLPKAEV